jgi:hypothetical protein
MKSISLEDSPTPHYLISCLQQYQYGAYANMWGGHDTNRRVLNWYIRWHICRCKITRWRSVDIESSFWFYGNLRGKSLYRLHRDVLGKLRFERKFLVENRCLVGMSPVVTWLIYVSDLCLGFKSVSMRWIFQAFRHYQTFSARQRNPYVNYQKCINCQYWYCYGN